MGRLRSSARARALLLAASLLCALAAPAPAPATPTAAPTPDDVPCRPIGVAARNVLPAGPVSCLGVRPGGYLQTSLGSCTFNFLFTGSDGDRYIGTAGHCIIDSEQLSTGSYGPTIEKVWAKGKGPLVKDHHPKRIGRFVYAILSDKMDFALIRLDRGVRPHADMCFFGGPKGWSNPRGPDRVLHYVGHGFAIGEVLGARTAIATGTAHDRIHSWGVAAPGDSGAGVIDDDGRAIGVLVTVGYAIYSSGTEDSGVVGITRIKPQVERAERKLRLDLRLKTATY